jgi:hypothetical protein
MRSHTAQFTALESDMFTHPESMRAVYKARSDDLNRRFRYPRPSTVRGEPRINLKRIATTLRPNRVLIRAATVRSP